MRTVYNKKWYEKWTKRWESKDVCIFYFAPNWRSNHQTNHFEYKLYSIGLNWESFHTPRSTSYYQDAELLLFELLPNSRATLGENHPNTLMAILDLGSAYYEQARYIDAESMYLDCMERTTDSMGMDHPNTQEVHEMWMDLHYHMMNDITRARPTTN